MLELLISVLMSLGISFSDSATTYKVSQEVMDKIHSSADFDRLGGDAELSKYAQLAPDPPKADDGVVPTQDIDPAQ